MKKQARLMEQQLEALRAEMEAKIFTGTAGNGLVTVAMNGNKELQSMKINPECVDPKDLEGLQDLIVAACKEAYQKIEAENPQGSGGMPF